MAASQRHPYGHDRLGESNIKLNFDMDSRVFSLNRTVHNFGAPISSHLKIGSARTGQVCPAIAVAGRGVVDTRCLSVRGGRRGAHEDQPAQSRS